MDTQIQMEIDIIKENILKAVPAEAIYLFGSYANGIPNEHSDFDFYVVIPNDGLRPVVFKLERVSGES